jgi:hypothetical protein
MPLRCFAELLIVQKVSGTKLEARSISAAPGIPIPQHQPLSWLLGRWACPFRFTIGAWEFHREGGIAMRSLHRIFKQCKRPAGRFEGDDA